MSPLPAKDCQFDLYSALIAIKQLGFPVYNSDLRGSVSLSCCRAVCIAAVTTCFNNLGMTQLGCKVSL